MAAMNSDYTYTAQPSSGLLAGLLLMQLIIFALIGLPIIIGMWKTFKKAGEPGWAAIVPIYNLVVLLKVARRPVWWILLFLLPFVSVIMIFVISIDVAKAFNKGAGFGIGLALLPPIFYLVLGFGSAQYGGGYGQAGYAGALPTGGALPAAGWYPDPYQEAAQRYWDGTAWTGHTA